MAFVPEERSEQQAEGRDGDAGAGEHSADHPLDQADLKLGVSGFKAGNHGVEVGPGGVVAVLGGLLNGVRGGVKSATRSPR